MYTWAPVEIFVGGGGQTKKGPHHGEKSNKKGPHMMEVKAPYNEKKVAKRPPYEEKVAKRPPI